MDGEKQGWNCLLLIVCIAMTIGVSIPAGFCFSALNGNVELIKEWAKDSFSSRYNVNLNATNLTLLWSSIVAVFMIGGILGSLLSPCCNERVGRKGSLQVTAIIFCISALCMSICRFMNSVELLLLGRLLCGAASALVFSILSMYLVELAPVELSGSVGVFTNMGLTGGVLWGQIFNFDTVLGTKTLWPLGISGFVLFVLIGMIPSIFFPESPAYLMLKGNKEAAKKALGKLRKNSQRVDQEMAAMEDVLKGASANMSMKECIKDSKLTMGLIVTMSFCLVQAGSGTSHIWSYSVGIYVSAGFTLSTALWITFFTGVMNFIASLCGPMIMMWFNRRTLMMFSCISAATMMLCLSIALSLKPPSKNVAYVCIVLILLFILCMNCALSSLPFFIASEIFLGPPRAAATALGSLTNWIGLFIFLFIFPTMYDLMGGMAFLVCVIILLFGALITYMYLPETRNRSPEEIAPLLENGFKSKVK